MHDVLKVRMPLFPPQMESRSGGTHNFMMLRNHCWTSQLPGLAVILSLFQALSMLLFPYVVLGSFPK